MPDEPAADPERLSPDEIRALRAECDRALGGHGIRSVADAIAEIQTLPPDDLAADVYGNGGAVAALESEVRELLGKPAAVFMPSGTMAQQIALRIHADRRGRRVVAFHPTCHLELHEDQAYQRLHGLAGRTLGDGRDLITIDDLQAVHEPLAALLIELPQREIGGRLPAWEDLVALIDLARSGGAAVHLDGARLWESGTVLRPPALGDRRLFDSVYVSFYKGLGGLPGASCWARRTWWRRRGSGATGTAARCSTSGRTPRRALPACACGFRAWRPTSSTRAPSRGALAIDGVEVVPHPPQTPMMHIHLRTSAAAVVAGVRRMATEQRLWTWGGSAATDTPAIRRVELTVGDATLAFSPEAVASAVRELLPA